MATSSGLFLATIYNQSQLAERKHVARYRSINTVATAVPLSAHPSPLAITTKLAAAILGGRLFGGVLPAQYCLCGVNGQRTDGGSFVGKSRLRYAVSVHGLSQAPPVQLRNRPSAPIVNPLPQRESNPIVTLP